MEKKELGIYIHIPFCKDKCSYCDFISFKNMEEKVDEYVNCIVKEIESKDWKKINKNYKVTTIYIGGGTPSYIQSKHIIRILNTIKKQLGIKQFCYINNEKSQLDIKELEDIDIEKNQLDVKELEDIDIGKNKLDVKQLNDINQNIEITIEINPGTINEEKLQSYKDVGINRLSIGLQSTNNKLLSQIGRIHTFEQFMQAYNLSKKVGFKNINVDLMLGLPNQTIEDLKQSVEKIIKLNPNHISIYSLILEEGTPLFKLVEAEKVKLPDEEVERQMYWYVKNKLELSGYNHYEISNFSKNGKESKHNMNCWNQEEYLGFGLSAHSYFENKRFSNVEDLKIYMKNIQDDQIKNNVKIHEIQTIDEQRKEFMLLGLRKIEGISISKFKEKFIDNPIFLFKKELEKLNNEGLIQIDGDFIKLTSKGLDFANIVWEEFV